MKRKIIKRKTHQFNVRVDKELFLEANRRRTRKWSEIIEDTLRVVAQFDQSVKMGSVVVGHSHVKPTFKDLKKISESARLIATYGDPVDHYAYSKWLKKESKALDKKKR